MISWTKVPQFSSARISNMQLLKYAAAIALFASSALSQGISIVLPTPGTTITPGSTLTVQIGTDVGAVSVFFFFFVI